MEDNEQVTDRVCPNCQSAEIVCIGRFEEDNEYVWECHNCGHEWVTHS
jgi:Zn ribbon nucleic-acid-binding protein